VKDAIELMQSESKIDVVELKVDGGATSNHFLMLFQADILNSKIVASHVSELSAMGSVYLAGLGVG
jgi:glycerol kinase